MPDGKRLWRTNAGRLVEDGHADAVVLAYGEDDPVDEGRENDNAQVEEKPKRPAKKAAVKPKK